MRQRVISFLRWCLHKLEPPVVDLPVEHPMAAGIRSLMAHQDTIDGRSGEAKRHQVLAALIKSGLSESAAGLEIELEVQRRKGRVISVR